MPYDSTRITENQMPYTYPPDTKAFLYYSMSPERPRIAGELRLRVASGDDYASFESGSDLLRTNGQPWFRPLYVLPKHYSPLYEKLREDGLVPDDLDIVLSTFPSATPKYGPNHLYALNDPFMVDFTDSEIRFSVITEQGVGKIRFDKFFFDYREIYSNRLAPYTGAYTNHHLSRCSFIDYSHYLFFLWICRKCLGSI